MDGGEPYDGTPQHDGPGDDNHRPLRNLAALVFLALLVAGGVWLAEVMARQSKLEDCLLSGRTNCAPIETSR
jgi:hypothetical protein